MGSGAMLPPVNDIIAVVIVICAYLLRFSYVGTPDISPPAWLVVTTDFILPSMAGAYLFVLAMVLALDRWDH